MAYQFPRRGVKRIAVGDPQNAMFDVVYELRGELLLVDNYDV
jgi:hypothetical protein